MEYEIVYSKIKNVYIHIKDGEVIVKAPRRVSKKEIDKIVNSKEEWIKKTLAKTKNKSEKEKLYTDEEFKDIVEDTTNELIKETGLIPNKVRIRDIKYAWGSCSANKNMRLSKRLNLINIIWRSHGIQNSLFKNKKCIYSYKRWRSNSKSTKKS